MTATQKPRLRGFVRAIRAAYAGDLVPLYNAYLRYKESGEPCGCPTTAAAWTVVGGQEVCGMLAAGCYSWARELACSRFNLSGPFLDAFVDAWDVPQTPYRAEAHEEHVAQRLAHWLRRQYKPLNADVLDAGD